MNCKTKSCNPIKLMKDYFKLKGYSGNTINTYINYVVRVRIYSEKDIYQLTVNDFNNFNLGFSKSHSFSNQLINAAKIYFKHGLGKSDKYLDKLYRPNKIESLPNVIPEAYLRESISNINNLKHRSILSLAYSIGLRSGDIRNLKLSDLNSKSMQVKIVEGKGKKDAYLPLYENIKNLLFEYCRKYKPKEYLFEGQSGNKYSGTSLNKLIKKYIGKEYHFHNIRHSTATHLINKGIDISFIQKLLRHKDIKTTLIYLKISTQDLARLPQLVE